MLTLIFVAIMFSGILTVFCLTEERASKAQTAMAAFVLGVWLMNLIYYIN